MAKVDEVSQEQELISKNESNLDPDNALSDHAPLIKLNDTNTDGDNDDTEQTMLTEESSTSSCWGSCCYYPKKFISLLDRADKKLSSYIFKWSPGKVLDVLIAIPCLAFSYFGFPLWIIVYIIIMQSYLYALCVLVSIVVTQIMKRCIKRSRPKLSDLGERWFYLGFEDVSAEHSFPSGDTSQSAVFAVTLGYSISEYYFLGLVCVTPFVALGMLYLYPLNISYTFYDDQGGSITGDITLEIQLAEH